MLDSSRITRKPTQPKGAFMSAKSHVELTNSDPGEGQFRLRGTLRDALAAAGSPFAAIPSAPAPMTPSVDRGDATPTTTVIGRSKHVRIEPDEDPTPTVRYTPARSSGSAVPSTQRVRGKSSVQPIAFHQEPVVGWLVVVGGPGLGAFRPIFEGNNSLGRSPTQRIAIDFGDDAISAEEQVYIRYDSIDRTFLLVPNMAKTNIVAVNQKKPTSAVPLMAMDLITMGRTQLCFMPFCGKEFDWGELGDAKP